MLLPCSELTLLTGDNLSGKTAVVTGGITGLGLAITRCLVSAGAKVIALSRTDEKQGNEILKEFGGKAVFYQFDITDTDHGVLSKFSVINHAVGLLAGVQHVDFQISLFHVRMSESTLYTAIVGNNEALVKQCIAQHGFSERSDAGEDTRTYFATGHNHTDIG